MEGVLWCHLAGGQIDSLAGRAAEFKESFSLVRGSGSLIVGVLSDSTLCSGAGRPEGVGLVFDSKKLKAAVPVDFE